MRQYAAALDGLKAQSGNIGMGRTKPGTVNAAIAGYYTCAAYRNLAPSTQYHRRRSLERFREQHGDKPEASNALSQQNRQESDHDKRRRDPGDAADGWRCLLPVPVRIERVDQPAEPGHGMTDARDEATRPPEQPLQNHRNGHRPCKAQ